VEINIRYARVADHRLLAEVGRRLFTEAFVDQNRPEDMLAYLTTSFGPQIQAAEGLCVQEFMAGFLNFPAK
jgi:hypothetical protein